MYSLRFNDYYIKDWYSIGGIDEEKSNIKKANYYIKDNYFGLKTLEDAEIKMDKLVVSNLIKNNNIGLIIGSDLSNQLGNMNYALKNNNISYLGIYNACSSFIEGLIIGGRMVNNTSDVLVITSSHSLVSERQFRFPVEYGSIKKSYGTNTITSSIGVVVTKLKTNIKITCGTIGSVIDYGINDVINMGAIMAPGAANVINSHLINFNRKVSDYDFILTGDLGKVGLDILKRILEDDYKIVADNVIDAGSLIYKKNQNKGSGGSGPTCLPFAFFNKLIHSRNTKRVLLVGTGALHNPTLVNQGKNIPCISHAIEIEVNHDI